jgi:glycine betaine/proline transport system substrate-binding protein
MTELERLKGNQMKRLFALLAALALIVAACGGDSAGDDNPTITFVVNPWTASALNVSVAAQLVTDELGYPTEVITIDENEAMFTGLSDGTLDAVLEIWPSGITDTEQAFFDDGTVVDIGGLGAIGKIGWFVPQYVIDERPEMATWEGLTSDAAAEYFATAETGDLGRFLGTDPSYSQYDALIIENLGLPFEVIFSGSEPATVAELDARSAAGEPVIMYWWTPTAAVGKYGLVNVALPEFTPECGASGAAADTDVACDYPEDPIFKAASAQLEDKAPDVWSFLQAFTITNDDQLEMLPSAEIEGDDIDDVAAAWIAAHEDVWSTWLP